MPRSQHSEEDEMIKTRKLNIETSQFKQGSDVNVKVYPPFSQTTNTNVATSIPFIFFRSVCPRKKLTE